MLCTQQDLEEVIPYLIDVVEMVNSTLPVTGDADAMANPLINPPPDEDDDSHTVRAAIKAIEAMQLELDDNISVLSSDTRHQSLSPALPDQSENEEESELEPYTQNDLEHILFNKLLRRVTLEEWLLILAIIEATAPEPELRGHERLTLHPCPKNGELHNYNQVRRCVRCDVQLCKSCEKCLLDDCQLVTSNPPLQLEDLTAVGVELSNSIAAKRVSGSCGSRLCLGSDYIKDGSCNCASYLHRAQHSCEEGEMHMCSNCYDDAFRFLSASNTYVVSTAIVGSSVYNILEYACICGRPASSSQPFKCVICLGVAKFSILNDFSWMLENQNGLNSPQAAPTIPNTQATPSEFTAWLVAAQESYDGQSSTQPEIQWEHKISPRFWHPCSMDQE